MDPIHRTNPGRGAGELVVFVTIFFGIIFPAFLFLPDWVAGLLFFVAVAAGALGVGAFDCRLDGKPFRPFLVEQLGAARSQARALLRFVLKGAVVLAACAVGLLLLIGAWDVVSAMLSGVPSWAIVIIVLLVLILLK